MNFKFKKKGGDLAWNDPCQGKCRFISCQTVCAAQTLGIIADAGRYSRGAVRFWYVQESRLRRETPNCRTAVVTDARPISLDGFSGAANRELNGIE